MRMVSSRLQTMLLEPVFRHRTWKGIITPTQLAGVREGMEMATLKDRATVHLISKAVKSILRVVGNAVLAMRKAAWKSGGPVVATQMVRAPSGRRQGVQRGKSGSILALLGVMSPKEAVCWELDRRKRRTFKQPEASGLEVQAVGEKGSSKVWDVH